MNIYTTTNYLCRLYDLHSGADLLLEGCTASVLITDVHASVTLSQRFTSPAYLSSLISGVYTFGLPADAAVCGFSMVRQDGTKVDGIVKEKQEAKREYTQALQQGKTASLGSQETADVFSIAVGNILPSETVTINLRYVQTLTDDEKKDQIKFIFPRTYAQRYGAAPTMNAALGTTAHQPFQMNVTVQQAGAIKSIACPSGHPISFELGVPDGFTAPDETSHLASVSLTDRTGYLTQDVVLVITAMGLDAPRCFIEPHPSPNHETTALALTFVPRFKLPDVPGGMEYIFLVDRSGSMDGQNIQLVREALVVLLRGLPSVGTTFNIFSFGSRTTKLWESSQAYSQATLEEATSHVDAMYANYGGTEIASALESVFASLAKPLVRPVAVLLLTDGGAWDVPRCVSHTQTAVTGLPIPNDPNSFVRVFTVGIGDGASTDTCDSIARAGGGISVYVKQGEPVTGKCARLVRAARIPQLKIQVAWGLPEDEDDFEIIEDASATPDAKTPTAKTISLFDDDAMDVDPQSTGPLPKPNPTLPPPARIQQAPVDVPTMFPGTRTQVFAIVQTPSSMKRAWPAGLKNIKVKGKIGSTGDLVELVVPVSKVLTSPFTGSENSTFNSESTFLHTLSAKALIRDRVQGKHAFPASVSALFKPAPGDDKAELKAAYLKKDIIRLGTEYGLASEHTSFIAIDHRTLQDQVIPPLPSPSQVAMPQAAGGLFGATGGLFGAAASVMRRGRPAASVIPPQPMMRLTGGPPPPPPVPTLAGYTSSALAPPHVPRAIPAAPALPLAVPPPPGTVSFQSFRAKDATRDRDRERERAPAFAPRGAAVATSQASRTFGPLFFSSTSASSAPSSGGSLFGAPPATSFGFGASPQNSAAQHLLVEDEEDELQDVAFSLLSAAPVSVRSKAPVRSTMTPGALLTAIARHQQWHGGFSSSPALLTLLGNGLKFSPSISRLDENGFTSLLKTLGINNPDVGATLLAVIWMEREAGEEAEDMKDKAEDWVKSEVGGDDQAAALKLGVLNLLATQTAG
ncbi:hypothetical protein GYMLUDRAFT_83446 [Collybiopsis luxurians FD-317 M1]|uniref:Unplaced genomic scaffold GYMLUscaffold_14, whole genome shotgun sequence n=1 Tax=Collybiopsis luxurians FD-317 M1 TaxID=944289 RepID=A0A0D0CM15_9AGAR|nr:hypothetical protein GYMLUDRAFT_83446 [Collybiopsis luxurians FD-317 M1]